MAKKKKKPANRKTFPGHLERRGDGWRWTVRLEGRRHRKHFAVTEKDDAEERARTEYSKLKAETRRYQVGTPEPLVMSELIGEFEALDMPQAEGAKRAYGDSIKVIRRYFVELLKDPRADRLVGPDIMRFIDWRAAHEVKNTGRKVKPRTVAKDRAVLHRIFERAGRRGYVESNPVAMTDVPKGDRHQPVILTDAEFDRLLEATNNPMTRTYILFLAETGMRSESDALRLRWEDVDLEDGFVHVRSRPKEGQRTKSGKSRFVPMTRRLRQAMREHFAAYRFASYNGKPTPWVFHHLMTRRHHTAGEQIRSLYDSIKGAAKRAGLPADFRPHDLRHRRATIWLGEGRGAPLVKEALGHADLRTTMEYMHLAKEHLRALVEEQEARPRRRRRGHENG